uniref:Uncharacterized protein n=1 Tax=Aegilops tauschii subsp. strangulata TaxID=200361 RepID=A0A453HYB4_AEGTS
MDVSGCILVLNTSISATSNLERREYHLRHICSASCRTMQVELQRGRPVQSAGPNMQASPRTYHPSLQAAGVATIPMRPPAAPYLTPTRAATTTSATATPARAQAGFSWTPKRPELKPPSVQRATFAWPPTEEENASISQCLYGPRGAPQRRLPVFVSICPA